LIIVETVEFKGTEGEATIYKIIFMFKTGKTNEVKVKCWINGIPVKNILLD
jgi:hypothetical protein